MIAVADAGPLHYLVLIGAADVLESLFTRVVVPRTVASELQHRSAPDVVRAWMAQSPAWCEIRPDLPPFGSIRTLDPGEQSAIALALHLGADRLLIDEWEGRAEAARLNLPVTGTVGVLAEAHIHRLCDFDIAIAKLRQTNFYISTELIEHVRRRLADLDAGSESDRAYSARS